MLWTLFSNEQQTANRFSFQVLSDSRGTNAQKGTAAKKKKIEKDWIHLCEIEYSFGLECNKIKHKIESTMSIHHELNFNASMDDGAPKYMLDGNKLNIFYCCLSDSLLVISFRFDGDQTIIAHIIILMIST